MSDSINPHFNTVGEVIKPQGDCMGWTDGTTEERDALDTEKRLTDEFQAEQPEAFEAKPAARIPEARQKQWDAFQQERGRFPGSNDLSLLDEFVHGEALVWLPQIIGSCVSSNTIRGWSTRMFWQIALEGQPQEYLGRKEYGPNNYCPSGAFQYGLAREIAGMRGSDGLYAAPYAKSLMRGVLMCSTPAFVSFMRARGMSAGKHFPEPQSKTLYREFGNHRHLHLFKPHMTCRLKESPKVTSVEQLWDFQQAGKPAFVCSSEAIHEVGRHPDGFPIHARNPRDKWMHNMHFNGAFIASDGERFFRQCNQSWGRKHVYTRRYEEVKQSFRSGRLTVHAIGEIDAPPAAAPMIG